MASPVGGSLYLVKTASRDTVNLDLGVTNLTYTLDVLNNYTSTFGGIVVTDTLPAEVSFVSSDPPASLTNGHDYVFDIGTLEPGKRADLAIWDMAVVEAAGAWDPVAALVLCGPGRVRDLFVEGRQVVRDGQLATIDLPRVIEVQTRLARRLAEGA